MSEPTRSNWRKNANIKGCCSLMDQSTLHARWILPLDTPPIQDGVVSMAHGRIVAVGRSAPISTPCLELGNAVLMPGMVNAHTHLEFSHRTCPLGVQGIDLPDWIRLVIAERTRIESVAEERIASGLAESLRYGVTTVGEISTINWSPARAEQLYERTAGRLPSMVQFEEVIGFSSVRADSVIKALESRWSLADNGSNQGPGHGPDWRPGLSPHAPYTVHPRLVERLVDVSIRHNLPVAMHLAESTEELQLLQSGDGPLRDLLRERSMWDETAVARGSRPLDYLKRLALGPRSLVIHGNYLRPDEIEWMAQHHGTMSLVYCPRTHGYFQHAPYPLAEMLAKGVHVVLGTDSRGSNPDLSLVAEMREVVRKHPRVEAERIVRMGTLLSAEALGLEHAIGSITPGKWANLTAIPCSADCTDPYEAVVRGEKKPKATWLRGVQVGRAG
jgi:aminodeoxyfutalosine deaminase